MTEPDEHADLAEQNRLRRTKRHLILSAAAVAVFALALVGVYILVPRSPDPAPSPVPVPSPTASPATQEQQTVLIQATTAEGAMGNVLTAVSGTDPDDADAVLLAVPADLVVSAPGIPPQPMSQTVATLDTLRPASATAATLGVRVDASWRLDRKALAGLVDSVSGITVTVPERMRVRDDAGQIVLALRAGRQRLPGTAASWYAAGQVLGQTDLQATARFDEVLLRTLARLPDSDLDIRESLTALGALAPSTIATQDLADYLHDLSIAVRSGRITRGTIPSTLVDLGNDVDADGVVHPLAYRWTDYTEATPLVRTALPSALWRAGVDGPPRVLVMAAPGKPGWIGYADNALSDGDFVFVDGRGTPHRTTARSSVTVRGERTWGRAVADALGIPSGRVVVVGTGTVRPPQGPPWADVDVTLGRGYTPGIGE